MTSQAFPPREPQTYDEGVLAAVDPAGTRAEFVRAYALAYADWRAGVRPQRPKPDRYQMSGSQHWVNRLVDAL